VIAGYFGSGHLNVAVTEGVVAADGDLEVTRFEVDRSVPCVEPCLGWVADAMLALLVVLVDGLADGNPDLDIACAGLWVEAFAVTLDEVG
jgi:hypothetical protein